MHARLPRWLHYFAGRSLRRILPIQYFSFDFTVNKSSQAYNIYEAARANSSISGSGGSSSSFHFDITLKTDYILQPHVSGIQMRCSSLSVTPPRLSAKSQLILPMLLRLSHLYRSPGVTKSATVLRRWSRTDGMSFSSDRGAVGVFPTAVTA